MANHSSALLILLTCLLMTSLSHGASCPTGWTIRDTGCFQFGTSPASWSQAQAACRAMDAAAHLAEVKTPGLDTYLRQYASARNYQGVWLGAMRSNGRFNWISGSPLAMSYENWAPSEPTGLNPRTRVPENCLSMWRDLQYRWNDEACTTLLNYVCETPATACP